MASDGGAFPRPIDPSERIDAIVEMKQPGVWVFGSVEDDMRGMGMGVVIEYAGQGGKPQWSKPQSSTWDYTVFGTNEAPREPDERLNLVFEKIPGGHGGFNRWTINGKSWPDVDPLLVKEGHRYRITMENRSGDDHPIHFHRHTFEITRIGGKPAPGDRFRGS